MSLDKKTDNKDSKKNKNDTTETKTEKIAKATLGLIDMMLEIINKYQWIILTYVWGMFNLTYAVSADLGTTFAVNKLNNLIEKAEADASFKIRKPLMMAIIAYLFAVIWFHVLFFTLIAYFLCAMLCITAVYAHPVWESIVKTFFLPEVLLQIISIKYLPVHAIIFFSCIIMGCSMVLIYIKSSDIDTDDNSDHVNKLHPKMLRIIFTCVTSSLLMYVIFTIYDIIMSI